jgi:preprotein translocase subunit SecB
MEQSELRLSPLQLNRYFIKELSYAVKGSFEGRYDPTAFFPYPQLLSRVKSTRNESDARAWKFELTVESNDAKSEEFPYSLRIVMVGDFTVAESYPAERADLLARVNGPSLLYSAAREALVLITSRSGFPAIVLPSVLFLPPEEGAAKVGEPRPAPPAPAPASEPPAVAESKAAVKGRAKAARTSKKGR